MNLPFDSLLLSLIGMAMLVVLVLVIYMIDRINNIERETRSAMQSLASSTPVSKGPFAGLSGKKLWDAMSGRPDPELDNATLLEVRERYEPILLRHIELLFQEGQADGKSGLSGTPKNSRQIAALRGTVESWLPNSQANAVYQAGLQSTQTPAPDWAAVAQQLDEAVQFLCGKTLITLKAPLSQTLLPEADAAAVAAAALLSTSAPPAKPAPIGQQAQSAAAALPPPRP